jgi:hypothetical protein
LTRSEDQEAIEKVKHRSEAIKSVVEFATGGVLKFMAGDADVDILESVGTMASFAVDHFSDRTMGQLEAALEKDSEILEDAETREAMKGLEAAKAKMRGIFHEMRSARSALLVSMGKRKAAYETAGHASASVSGGSASTKAKIASLVAALPTVEYVVGSLQNLVDKTADASPTYSQEAGVGFGIAQWHRMPEANAFVRAIGFLEYYHTKFGVTLGEWQPRLASLKAVKERLGGARPVGNVESSEPSVEKSPESTDGREGG